jgi:hypothetical protein
LTHRAPHEVFPEVRPHSHRTEQSVLPTLLMLPNKRGRVRRKGGSSRNWRPAQPAAGQEAEEEELKFRQLGRESLHFRQCRNFHHRTDDHHGARRESEHLRLEHGELATRPPVDGQSGRWTTARQSKAEKSRFIEADNLHNSKQ